MNSDHINTTVRACLDVGSLGVLSAWWAGVAPSIATTLTVMWVGYCLIEAMVKLYYRWKRNRKSGS